MKQALNFLLPPALMIFFVSLMFCEMKTTETKKRIAEKYCTGYTVLDNTRVVDCKGDTVFYNWQMKLVSQ